MGGSTTAPAIRFAGFTDAWEQRKLGDVGHTKSGIGFPESEQGGQSGTPFFKVSDMNTPGNELEMHSSNNYVTQDQISRRGWTPVSATPAMLFAKVGAAVMLNRKRLIKGPFLMDNNTMAYSFDPSVWDTGFGVSLFDTLDLTSLVQVGALPSYNGTDVENLDLRLPNSRDEQRSVGQFFASIDHLITLHQREYDKTASIKKALLEKMFPKDGEDSPEVRFAGFTDAWEQRKLGELVDESDNKVQGGEYPIATSSRQGIFLQAEYFDGARSRINETLTFHLVPQGYVTYRHMSDDSTFHFNQNTLSTPVVVSKEYPVFTSRTDSDTRFVTYHLNNSPSFAAFAHMQKSGGTRVRLYFKVLEEYELLAPSHGEQQAIGALFTKLDHLITLHQRELEKLRNVKKALLEKMFV